MFQLIRKLLFLQVFPAGEAKHGRQLIPHFPTGNSTSFSEFSLAELAKVIWEVTGHIVKVIQQANRFQAAEDICKTTQRRRALATWARHNDAVCSHVQSLFGLHEE
jgi:hypothetical protein